MVATPFRNAGSALDLISLHNLAATSVQRGCDSLIALGVIAEPQSLTVRERLDAVECILDAAPGTSVAAGALMSDSDRRLEEVRRLSAHFGTRLRSLMVPVCSSDPRKLTQALRDAHRASGLPLIVQDYPDASGVRIAIPDLVSALEGLDFIEAIKAEASPTLVRVHDMSQATGVVIMAGRGGIGLIDDLAAGATAFACGVTSPEIFARALDLFDSGDETGSRSLVSSVASLVNFETQPQVSIGIRKEHWRRQGVISSAVTRPPTAPYPPYLDHISLAYGFNPA